MGVAVRNAAGKMELLTGNQIGSLMAWYRIKTFIDLGILTRGKPQTTPCIIKTFVTTDLQNAIAEHFGIALRQDAHRLQIHRRKARANTKTRSPPTSARDYRELPEPRPRALRLEHSSFFVFGGEESYGYIGADFVRDKDGNGAVVMFAEVAAYAKSRGMTLHRAARRDLTPSTAIYLEKNGTLDLRGRRRRGEDPAARR